MHLGKKIFVLLLFPFLIGSTKSLARLNIPNESNSSKPEEHRFILKFKTTNPIVHTNDTNPLCGIDAIDLLNEKYQCIAIDKLYKGEFKNSTLQKKADSIGLSMVYVFTFQLTSATLLREYLSTGHLDYIEKDEAFEYYGDSTISVTPNDVLYPRQWALNNYANNPDIAPSSKTGADIAMERAWGIEQGDSSIIVGVIDSGCNTDHPEFEGRIWTNSNEVPNNNIDDDENGYIDDYNGWNFFDNTNKINDDNPVGHGTNVTGIIGANGNNTIGYAGVDWNCKLLTLKAGGGSGLTASAIAEAVYYAINMGTRIINASLGSSTYSATIDDAVTFAEENDVLIVCAMGNDGNETKKYPAALENKNIIAVGATNSKDKRAYFSNFGSHIDVTAPGDNIYGLHNVSNTNYERALLGTSQATPHVAGLAALLYAQKPSRTAEEIINIITITADDETGKTSEDIPGWDKFHGHGRINAYKALSYDLPEESTKLKLPESKLVIYPNPSTTQFNIFYNMLSDSRVQIQLSNLLGNKIYTLIDEEKTEGIYTYQWEGDLGNGRKLNRGIYIISFYQGEKLVESNKLIYLPQ